MKTLVVSDIHGEYDKLMEALQRADFDKNIDTLIVAGDLFDRGSKSKEVYEYLIALPKTIFILGNHDRFLIDYLEGKDATFNIRYNGLGTTIKSFLGYEVIDYNDYSIPQKLNKKYPMLLPFLKNFKLYHETDNHIIVHAGLDISIDDWRNSSEEMFTWDRSLFYDITSKIKETIVFGHTPTSRFSKRANCDIIQYQNKIAIDGGAAYGVNNKINVYHLRKEATK